MERIIVFDTTLRDGEQSPGCSMNTAEKIHLAHQLSRMGVDVIEAGFPIASPGDFEAVSRIAAEIKDSAVAGLARLNHKDIDRAGEAIRHAARPRLHTFIATSPIHMAHKLKMDEAQVLAAVKDCVARARNFTDDVEFSAEDASRSEPEFLTKVFETAIASGARTINVPDTVGYALPEEFGRLVRYVHDHVSNMDRAVLSVHCHNDLGLAVANTLSAIANGARQVEVTVNGIGERAGNAALEEIVMILNTRRDLTPFTTSIETTLLWPTSRLLTSITGAVVQANKAIVGDNAFAHESGIHQDGMLKNRQTYEIMRPEMIGLSASKLVLGKHSGRHALRDKLTALGYEVTDADLEKLFARFKVLADKKKAIYDEDIEALIAEELFRPGDLFQLRYLNVMSGTQVQPVATVGMDMRGEEVKRAGFGVGPVDAVYQTIMAMTGSRAELLRFSVSAITGGMDAQGEVTVRLQDGDYTATGRSSDPDILVASAKAFINGLNRLEQAKKQPLRPNSTP